MTIKTSVERKTGLKPATRNFSGQRWIRTTEGVSQQIYSLPHLATLVFAHFFCIAFVSDYLISRKRCKGTTIFSICK